MGSLQARSPMDRVEAMLANKSVRDDDLIYFTISPDYCLPDPALGSVGTKDRLVVRCALSFGIASVSYIPLFRSK